MAVLLWEPFYISTSQGKLKSNQSDKFFIKDTLPDGNCQFRAISEALKGKLVNDAKLNHKRLRKLIAEYILELSDQEVKEIINHYRLEKTNGEFIGKWDPFKVKTKAQFARQIKKSGFHFQGDNMTLSLLSRILNVDFVIVTKDAITELSQTHPKIIILYYTGDHYQTIGIKKKGVRKVITAIERANMPDILRSLIDKYYFLENEIRNYYEECKKGMCPFTLSVLYKHLQSKIKSFLINKHDITKIINDLLKSEPTARVQNAPENARVQNAPGNARVQNAPSTARVPIRIRKTSHK